MEDVSHEMFTVLVIFISIYYRWRDRSVDRQVMAIDEWIGKWIDLINRQLHNIHIIFTSYYSTVHYIVF